MTKTTVHYYFVCIGCVVLIFSFPYLLQIKAIYHYFFLSHIVVLETYVCPETHFKCNNHFCIPTENVCDFQDNCGDNSDEEACSKYNF